MRAGKFEMRGGAGWGGRPRIKTQGFAVNLLRIQLQRAAYLAHAVVQRRNCAPDSSHRLPPTTQTELQAEKLKNQIRLLFSAALHRPLCQAAYTNEKENGHCTTCTVPSHAVHTSRYDKLSSMMYWLRVRVGSTLPESELVSRRNQGSQLIPKSSSSVSLFLSTLFSLFSTFFFGVQFLLLGTRGTAPRRDGLHVCSAGLLGRDIRTSPTSEDEVAEAETTLSSPNRPSTSGTVGLTPVFTKRAHASIARRWLGEEHGATCSEMIFLFPPAESQDACHVGSFESQEGKSGGDARVGPSPSPRSSFLGV